MKIRQPQVFLLLHVGGNDLGTVPIKELKSKADSLFSYIDTAMPGTIIIWSEILPRLWSGNEGLEGARKRFNTYVAKLVKQRKGFYLQHIKLQPFQVELFNKDGVHLSDHGNHIFLENIRLGLTYFLQKTQPWF